MPAMTKKLKFHFLCAHVFQMALKPDTDITIEGTGEIPVGQALTVGLCEDCADVLGGDLRKRKFKVTTVHPKSKRPNPK